MIKEKILVRKGYDEIARAYQANRCIFDNAEVLLSFSSYLPKNARVLDVGCGGGAPCAQLLIQAGFQVVGVDFSASMLEIAKEIVPEANLVKGDMTELGFRENSFDGLVALYSIIHISREMHASLYRSFQRILKPDGRMLICVGSDEWQGTGEYFGTRMFWSEPGLDATLQMVKNAGFQILSGKHLVIGGERHYWITAGNHKNASSRLSE